MNREELEAYILNHYSAQQFDAESIQHLNVDDAFLQEAVQGGSFRQNWEEPDRYYLLHGAGS